MEFTPFSDRDFDAYQQSKWQSNAFNRERLEVRQKLETLGRLLEPSMRAADGSPLACEVSAEHPALWNQHRVTNQQLFFSRNAEARKEIDAVINRKRTMAALIEDPSPLRNHIFLGVMIDNQQLELSLRIHADAAVDRDNLLRKSQEFFQREKLLGLLQELPPELSCGLYGQQERPCAEVDDSELQQLLEQFSSSDTWLCVRRSLGRDDALAQSSEELVDLARQTLTSLLPLHHYAAWSRENDFVSMKETLKAHEVKHRAKGLKKNDRIRVVRGMFTGKVGTVQGLDGKGGLKVLLGSMPVKLDSADVVKL